MYIEFDTLTSQDDFDTLQNRIYKWAEFHAVPYTTKVAKGLKLRLGLNYPQHFILFFITWNHSNYTVRNADQT